MKSTERFSNRVDNYVKYRPTYPPALLQFIKEHFGLHTDSSVADVGSGTGILTALLLNDGYKVYGVEPNEKMRDAATEQLSSYNNFISINGTGEATTLADHSVSLITVAQAFHWLDPPVARKEFLRILQPGGHIALIWNLRTLHTPFAKAYEAIKVDFGKDYLGISKSHEPDLVDFFGDLGYAVNTFSHSQQFDLAGLKGQLLSSSYIPLESETRYPEMIARLEEVFNTYQENGQVEVVYDTKIHYNP